MQQDPASKSEASAQPVGRNRHGGGLASWAIEHPVGVIMITLAILVLGEFTYNRLPVDLLPSIVNPEIRVRIIDPGVPAQIMEDRVTRQLEEQLAITENVIGVLSTSSEGRSQTNLLFQYGTDIDVALRDASTRLDRAKRFLPDSIDPPIIYKRDPSQRPVVELVVASDARSAVELRTWVDDVLAKWFLTLPGVAAAEVGGGLIREIQVLPDQRRLAGLGLTVDDVVKALSKENKEEPTGRVTVSNRELVSRAAARFRKVEDIAHIPIVTPDGSITRLGEIAQVQDTHEDERLRIRLNGVQGVKVSIQKQPNANTVTVAEAVQDHLHYLRSQRILPDDVEILTTLDQSTYVRNALNSTVLAAMSGAVLAMTVVWLFLGNIRRTLVIGSAIPIAITVTFLLMDLGGLSLNIMTLGGLAVGIGMLVDNTIVMLENVYRHQRLGERSFVAGKNAAIEVNSAIVASTSTNLAAIIPFLFIGGLVGLLFRELIFTITSAILASMIVALTLVPALATRIPAHEPSRFRRGIDFIVEQIQHRCARWVTALLERRSLKYLLVTLFVAGFYLSLAPLLSEEQEFLPQLDDGQINIRLLADPGSSLDQTDAITKKIEAIIQSMPHVKTVFTSAGGFVFGRSQFDAGNRSRIDVQLVPVSERTLSSNDWISEFNKRIKKQQIVGAKIRASIIGLRGIPLGHGDDAITLRIQGASQEVLDKLGDQLVEKLGSVEGIRNITHSSEGVQQELSIDIDRDRAAALGLTAEDISRAVRIAITGINATDFIQGDRSYNVRVRLPKIDLSNIQELNSILLSQANAEDNATAIYLGDVASIDLVEAESRLYRDNQSRVVNITASLAGDLSYGVVLEQINRVLDEMPVPSGYSIYDAGITKTLQEGNNLAFRLLMLAVFLVLVVMAVQYESIRNPIVILFGIPFAIIGVAMGMWATDIIVSMPVRLGIIMLAGMVVNNAIILVEYIELERARGIALNEAISTAVKLRIRPILMTTITTVVGLLPLAFALGEGSEMLQPLAITIIYGLSFSMLVSLFLIPIFYQISARLGLSLSSTFRTRRGR